MSDNESKPETDEKMRAFTAPDYVWDQVRARAVDGRTTVRAVMMRALKQAGFNVEEDDLDDRRAGNPGRPPNRTDQ